MQFPGQATGAIAVPKTTGELSALYQQRQELESQIRSLGESQTRLLTQRQMRLGDGDQAGAQEFNARLKEVTARLGRLEDQKLAADDAISQALARGVTTSNEVTILPPIPPVPDVPVPYPGFPAFPDASTTIPGGIGELRSQLRSEYERLMILEGVVIVLLGALAWRYWFRRAVERIRREMSGSQPAQRELKDAVDAIALEVERISEGQRFVTKLMAEKPAERTAIRD
jgi:hypothetical protein